MKKIIPILLLSFVMLSCGARQKHLEKETKKDEGEAKTEQTTDTSKSSETYTSESVYRFLSEIGLNIESKGQSYKLDFGGLKFEGDANLSFNKKDAQIERKLVKTIKTTFKSYTTFKSHITYKTELRYKNLQTERKGVSFGDILLIIGVSIVVWELGKYAIKSRLKL